MNNLPNDPDLREFYDTFSTNHQHQLEALMQTISELEPPHVAKPIEPPRRRSSRMSRRILIATMALLLIGVSLPLMSSVFETKPASTLPDGWSHAFQISSDKTPVIIGDDRSAMLEMWTEDGWLIACRKSIAGDVEWQVVLAKTEVAEEPKIDQTADDLTVTFGRYSIRDSSTGELQIRRQLKKATDPWPEMEMKAGRTMGTAGNWRGIKLSMIDIEGWAWVTSGPDDANGRMHIDLWVRVDQRSKERPGHGSSGGMISAQVYMGDRKATENGKLFTANRATTADLVKAAHGL